MFDAGRDCRAVRAMPEPSNEGRPCGRLDALFDLVPSEDRKSPQLAAAQSLGNSSFRAKAKNAS